MCSIVVCVDGTTISRTMAMDAVHRYNVVSIKTSIWLTVRPGLISKKAGVLLSIQLTKHAFQRWKPCHIIWLYWSTYLYWLRKLSFHRGLPELCSLGKLRRMYLFSWVNKFSRLG